MILMGTVSLTFTGFIYYLFPLITGRMYNEKAAKVHFVLAFFGVTLVFMINMYWAFLECPEEFMTTLHCRSG